MPCDYSEYHPKWTLIRRLILNRAKMKCEECGIENYKIIQKGSRETITKQQLERVKELALIGFSSIKALKEVECTRIILTIAHMDHDKTNNLFSNLKALCQKDHLSHDAAQHTMNRKYGRNWKRDQMSLWL